MLRASRTSLNVFHFRCSPALEHVGIARGFEAPLWINAKLVRPYSHSAKSRALHIVPRPGERPTNISVQQRTALFNVDQLRAGPRAVEFMAALPPITAIAEPTNIASLQPHRGALGEQLKAISAQHKWGPYWIEAQQIKYRGFVRSDFKAAPPAWKSSVQQLDVLNFSQLRNDGDAVDLSTVPVNFRYNMIMTGSALAEELRNEALRRGLKYPVVAAAQQIIEVAGCSILPECTAGFRPAHASGFDASSSSSGGGSKWRRSALIYNLDEFELGGAAIEKMLSLPRVTVQTSAFDQKPMTKQLVLEEKRSGQQLQRADDEEIMADDLERQQRAGNKSAALQQQPIEEDEQGLPKYKSKYWMKQFEAERLSDGAWKLRPDARGAITGVYLSSSAGMANAQQRLDGADTDIALGGAGSGGELGEMQGPVAPITRISMVPQLAGIMGADGQINTPTPPRVHATPYYFDADVKERDTFLASLGCFIS